MQLHHSAGRLNNRRWRSWLYNVKCACLCVCVCVCNAHTCCFQIPVSATVNYIRLRPDRSLHLDQLAVLLHCVPGDSVNWKRPPLSIVHPDAVSLCPPPHTPPTTTAMWLSYYEWGRGRRRESWGGGGRTVRGREWQSRGLGGSVS